jgi:putative redox protein
MVTHEITTAFQGGMAFSATIGQHTLLMDSNDGETAGIGPSPKRLMLASLAGCTGIDVVSILNKMKVDFTGLAIDVKANLTEDHPKIYKEVFITYHIRLEEKDRPKMEKAVRLSQEKYCGVSAMFGAFSTLHTSIDYL